MRWCKSSTGGNLLCSRGNWYRRAMWLIHFFLPFNPSHSHRIFQKNVYKGHFAQCWTQEDEKLWNHHFSERPWIYEWLQLPLGCKKGWACLCLCLEVHLFPFLVSSLHKWVVLFLARERRKNTRVTPAVEDLSNKAFNNGTVWQFYSTSTSQPFEGGRFSIKIKSFSKRNSVPCYF